MSTKSIRLILENGDKLVKMYSDIKNSFKDKLTNAQTELKWSNACNLFHSSYDILAFPGGLNRGMVLLKMGDQSVVEHAIDFLEADPYFFRSGYIKEDILRYLPRAKLTPNQTKRLQEIILARIKSSDRRREFKNYCKFAKRIADDGFIERINTMLLAADNPATIVKAEMVLASLDSGDIQEALQAINEVERQGSIPFDEMKRRVGL